MNFNKENKINEREKNRRKTGQTITVKIKQQILKIVHVLKDVWKLFMF